MHMAHSFPGKVYLSAQNWSILERGEAWFKTIYTHDSGGPDLLVAAGVSQILKHNLDNSSLCFCPPYHACLFPCLSQHPRKFCVRTAWSAWPWTRYRQTKTNLHSDINSGGGGLPPAYCTWCSVSVDRRMSRKNWIFFLKSESCLTTFLSQLNQAREKAARGKLKR